MNEPRLLESALRRWWVVLIVFVVTTVLTVLWVSPKPAVYESSGTYVLQPRGQQDEQTVRALDLLIRGAQINATYALIARSDAIKDTAVGRLDEVPKQAHLKVEAEAVTGTNALTITALSRDASTAHALAVAAGAATMEYVEGLHQPYQLVLLDPPELPKHPVNSKKSLTIVLGAILGLLAGLGLAAIIDRVVLLRTASKARAASDEQLALVPGSTQPMFLSPPPARAVGPPAAPTPESTVIEATADPAVQAELDRVASVRTPHSLGVLRLEPATANGTRQNGSGQNGSGQNGAPLNGADRNGNGHEPDDPGADGRVEALSECARRDGCTLIVVRERLYAIVCPDMNALDTSRHLSDWLAEIDFDDATSGLLVSMTVVEYCGDDPEPALPEPTIG
jgi:capsular polysaccharide biosynthesis protein